MKILLKKLNKKQMGKRPVLAKKVRDVRSARPEPPQKPTIKKKIVLKKKVEIFGREGDRVILDAEAEVEKPTKAKENFAKAKKSIGKPRKTKENKEQPRKTHDEGRENIYTGDGRYWCWKNRRLIGLI